MPLLKKNLLDLVTFNRGSGAMRTNGAGAGEVLPANVPRIDYDPVTLQPLGLLVEAFSTNVFCNSNVGGGVRSDSGVLGVRNTPLNKFVPTSGPVNFPAVMGGGGSITLKAGESINLAFTGYFSASITGALALEPDICFGVNLDGGSWVYAELQINTKTWVARGRYGAPHFTDVVNKITKINNLLYKVEWVVRFTQDAVTTRNFWSSFIQVRTEAHGGDFTADGVAGIVYGDCQAELRVPSSYIPTTNAAVARSPDSAIILGKNFTDIWNPKEGTFIVEFDIGALGGESWPGVFSVDLDWQNCLHVFIDDYNSDRLYFEIFNFAGGCTSGPQVGGAITAARLIPKKKYKFTISYSNSGVAVGFDGKVTKTPLPAAFPVLNMGSFNKIRIGGNRGGDPLGGHISKFQYIGREFKDSEHLAAIA